MTKRFAGKVVVVTGGNSGIGLASAKAFANEGAQVVITGRNADALNGALQEIGNDAMGYRSDVSDLAQITALFAKLSEDIGHIDVLFVNAGVLAYRSIESVTEEEWDWIQNINLKGAFFSVQGALPLMSRGSAIVLTGSTAGTKGAASASVYAASKGGLRSLGTSLASEFVEREIRVNVVSPDYTETAMFRKARGLPRDADRIIQNDAFETMPMKRMAKPEEVAAAVLFLASDAAAFITGAELFVDGGAMNFVAKPRGT